MIKAIISDIGNILVKVDLNQWEESLKKLGFYLPHHIFKEPALNQLIHLYGEGKITTEEYVTKISKEIKNKGGIKQDIPFEKFKYAWNSVIPNIYIESIDALQMLRSQGYQVYALSDTNEMHIAYIETLYQRIEPHKTFKQLFDKPYYSHITGHRKTNDEAWLQILNEQALKPKECLFIDDIYENIQRAYGLGIQVFHYKPENTMHDVLVTLEKLGKMP